ncbi:methionine aminopeptidase [Flavimobilis marinus]|uniref:Methionine aminopeptidase n=1 Tax=Flavimobilis marinus TaxID=285351 RepID=A0A1I2CX78_9MICO|nr:type I methionyl aminopeptidase [Flavimobilis marinus]GHG46686.1 methionine aminopeptidase [Flavimobilis marinus]SFE72927.1 methionyl aminopeptidase [Flavimobilis marinus]
MIELRTPEEIDAMRESGRVVARALAAVKEAAQVGTSLRELDQVARDVIFGAGATSPFLDYHPDWAPVPFPGVICASVNDAVVHGIPTDQTIADGDLVSIDCGAVLDGWASDSAISFVVGTPRQEDLDLIATTTAALEAGIAAAQVGGRLGDISNAIGRVANKARLGNLEDHGGHGIGRVMHGEPFVPNDGRPRRGMELKAGLVLALEPMFILGGSGRYRHGDDGWTLYTRDGSRSAHVEHTVAITADGPRILSAV